MENLGRQLYCGSNNSSQQDVDTDCDDSVELEFELTSIELSVNESNCMTYDDFLCGEIVGISLKQPDLESSNSRKYDDIFCVHGDVEYEGGQCFEIEHGRCAEQEI